MDFVIFLCSLVAVVMHLYVVNLSWEKVKTQGTKWFENSVNLQLKKLMQHSILVHNLGEWNFVVCMVFVEKTLFLWWGGGGDLHLMKH